jgi:hypothetical protein
VASDDDKSIKHLEAKSTESASNKNQDPDPHQFADDKPKYEV